MRNIDAYVDLCYSSVDHIRLVEVFARKGYARFGGTAHTAYGGRHFFEWSLIEYRQMVFRAAWTVLGVRRSVPAN